MAFPFHPSQEALLTLGSHISQVRWKVDGINALRAVPISRAGLHATQGSYGSITLTALQEQLQVHKAQACLLSSSFSERGKENLGVKRLVHDH